MELKTEIERLDKPGIGRLVWGEESVESWDVLSPRSRQLANHGSLLYQGAAGTELMGCRCAREWWEALQVVMNFMLMSGLNIHSHSHIVEEEIEAQRCTYVNSQKTPKWSIAVLILHPADWCRSHDLSRCGVGSQANGWRRGIQRHQKEKLIFPQGSKEAQG